MDRQRRRELGVQVPGEAASHDGHRCSRCHRPLSRASRVVAVPAKHRIPVVSGKSPSRITLRPRAKHCLRLQRNIRSRARALCVRRLEIRAGRPGRRRRTAGGAGAPPRKRPSLAQPGPSERSLLGFFLAGRPRRSLYASGPSSAALRIRKLCRRSGWHRTNETSGVRVWRDSCNP